MVTKATIEKTTLTTSITAIRIAVNAAFRNMTKLHITMDCYLQTSDNNSPGSETSSLK